MLLYLQIDFLANYCKSVISDNFAISFLFKNHYSAKM